ncbi:MAG: response regulator transcription factor [Firmicutes bacterium]|jgi:DNA-binding NarL/FixJ family response regulator|nr:response regulator transcription factor [Bacillota bacterium]
MSTVTKRPIRLIIADDHALLREGIRKILSLEPDMVVVGEAEDGDQVVQLARETAVDIILMDINMPNTDGIRATQIIKAEKPGTKIIALTIHDQEDYLFALIKSGISGYVLKDVRPQELIKTIRSVAEGAGFLPPSLTPTVFREFNRLAAAKSQEAAAPSDFDLTDRELEVLQQVSQGLSNKEIADKLFISEKTVRNHLTNIFQKLGVSDRTQAVLFAIKHKLVQAL